MHKPLQERVALVTGASRGAGRGIAIELGAAGATVYCTGRTSGRHRSEYNRPETIEETAELVTAAGGHGVPVRVDHSDVDAVGSLFEQIKAESGRLDILVNDIWGGDPFLGSFSTPFWEQDLSTGIQVLHNAVDTHIITSWFAAPVMVRQGSGLIVEMTDGEPENYHDHLFYDLPKKSAMRLAVSYATELGPHGIVGVALSPGWLRSEAMLEGHGVTEDNWQDWYWNHQDEHPAEWLASETPRYTGRAVVALATEREADRWNGKSVKTAQLAGEYGFTDVNGTTPGHGIYNWNYLTTTTPQRADYRGS
ncbi:SDR family oxidoreductase [Actinopolymorpha rutila]|nr:SDR family oxidoreductase [Actinopolymorpha rutila]